MAKFMVIGNYTAEGIKGVLKGGGTARVDAVSEACKGVGGSVDSFYFAFGGEDVYVVCDLPDNAGGRGARDERVIGGAGEHPHDCAAHAEPRSTRRRSSR